MVFTEKELIMCLDLINNCKGYDEYIIEKLSDWIDDFDVDVYGDFDINYIFEVNRIKKILINELRKRKILKLDDVR